MRRQPGDLPLLFAALLVLVIASLLHRGLDVPSELYGALAAAAAAGLALTRPDREKTPS